REMRHRCRRLFGIWLAHTTLRRPPMNPEEDVPTESEAPTETMTAEPRQGPHRPITASYTTLQLEVVGGPMDGVAARETRDTLTIGRGPRCDLALGLDPLVSTNHARVVREGDAFWLEDLGSRNGTYIGDQRIEARSVIVPGTLIVVGSTCVE